MSLRIPVMKDWKELYYGNACYLTMSLVIHLKFRHSLNEALGECLADSILVSTANRG